MDAITSFPPRSTSRCTATRRAAPSGTGSRNGSTNSPPNPSTSARPSAASTATAAASASTSCSRTGTRRCSARTRTPHREDAAARDRGGSAAAPAWRALPFDDRAAVFLRAADLLSGPWRETLAAATMLGQSKTAYQAEIDTPCELIDFWRFNVHFARQILAEQPISSPGVWNRVEYRPLEGFVYAITPFNFTAIAGNLPTAPGADGQHRGLEAVADPGRRRVLDDAAARGRRPARRRDQPGHRRRAAVSEVALADPRLAGIHFTGSTAHLPAPVARGRREHRPLPQLPAAGRRDRRQGLRGRAPSRRPGRAADRADPRRLRVPGAEVLGGLARLRPASVWDEDGRRLPGRGRRADATATSPTSPTSAAPSSTGGPSTGTSPRSTGPRRRERDRRSPAGGKSDDSEGFFVDPTVLLGDDPTDEAFTTEYFGPILSLHVYDDAGPRRTPTCSPRSTRRPPYALTGAVIADDRAAIVEAQAACASRPATSTSTTSRPVRSSGSSPSAAPAPPAPTTRPARR